MEEIRDEQFELTTPVAFFTFNRLDTTKRVFSRIKDARPKRLYLISDGARETKTGEKERVDEVRKFLLESIDWECEVFKDFSEKNLGCGKRLFSGISWVLSQEEETIILEDDVLPNPSFFRYCQEMLEYYRNDERIMLVGGSNSACNIFPTDKDYLFTKMPLIWGWATWRRAWELYDFNISTWPEAKKNGSVRKKLPLKTYWQYEGEFDSLYAHQFDTWDYQLFYAVLHNDKLCIAPRISYTENLGFEACEDATHTSGGQNSKPQYTTGECRFPIVHREDVKEDTDFDKVYLKRAGKHGISTKIKSLLGKDVNKSIFAK